MGAIFTVDLEDWHHGLHIDSGNHSSIEFVWHLQTQLRKHDVRAIFYVLGKFSREHPGMTAALKADGHVMKSHGIEHIRGEIADRQPYAWLGFTGGFYFRLFPYWLIKREVERNHHFYIHPHDLDIFHPRLNNPVMNWKRRVGLKKARYKLDKLLSEVSWYEPSED